MFIKDKAKYQAKEELINNAKSKFMEEYFVMSQSLKEIPSKGEEYAAVKLRIEELEHHMKCLDVLKELLKNQVI